MTILCHTLINAGYIKMAYEWAICINRALLCSKALKKDDIHVLEIKKDTHTLLTGRDLSRGY